MPAQTYMRIDPRRDHRLGVPRPDLSEKLGTPNACTNCHEDRSANWAAEAIARWYPDSQRREAPHFAESFQAVRGGAIEAAPALISIAGDLAQPGIVRATALDLLARYGPAAASAAVRAARDDDPLVRTSAVRALAVLPPEQRIAVVAPRLRDPLRAVRVEAAQVLSSLPPDQLDESTSRALEAALGEYKSTQYALTDTPPAHLNLAVLEMNRGQPESAIQFYLAALAMNPDFFPARANLAVLYDQLGRSAESERVLREGIARDPEQGEFHYSLGLILAAGGRIESAAGHLGRAAELLPGNARVHYNHGLALQRIDRLDRAEVALGRAVEFAPRDPEIVYALIVFYIQQGQWEQARPLAGHLVELTRGDSQAVALMERIEREAASPSSQ
jgi:Flp pilus assembly protein TadD